MPKLTLTLLSGPLALCRLAEDEPTPAWTGRARTFLSVTRTPTELSIVADEGAVPAELIAERGYRALRVEGQLPLDMIGIVAAIAAPLASAGVPIFPIATYETDYILVRESDVQKAVSSLSSAGHNVVDD